jgi:hypothetical protein
MAFWMSSRSADTTSAERSAAASPMASRPPRASCFAIRNAGVAILILMGVPMAQADEPKPDQKFPFAFATRGCTQEDAPALEIYFTGVQFKGEGTPAPPYLRIEIASRVNETIASFSAELTQLRRDPAKQGRLVRAELMEEAGQKSTWLFGRIELKEAVPGASVTGHFDFTSPAGAVFSRSFSAPYSNRPAVCG